MAPPVEAKQPDAPVSPFVIEDEPAPAAGAAPTETTPAPEEGATGAATVQVAPATVTAPAAARTPKQSPESKSSFEYPFWHRLHLVIGGGGSFGTRVYAEAEPFNLAAQKLSGPLLYFQPTITVFATNPREEKPSGDFELRAGLELKNHFLANNTDQGQPESSVDARSIGGLVEAIYHVVPMFAVGGNVNFGRMGLVSDNADVGAPFDATLEWGSEGMLTMGGQFFVGLWEGNLRAGINIDKPMGTFDLNAGPGNPPLRTAMDPIVGFGVGADVIGIVRTLTSKKSEDGSKEKKAK